MKAMQKAAKELNQKLGLDPAIKIVGNTKTTMRDQLIQSAALILEDDDITDETLELLATLSADEEDDLVEENEEDDLVEENEEEWDEEDVEDEEEWDEEDVEDEEDDLVEEDVEDEEEWDEEDVEDEEDDLVEEDEEDEEDEERGVREKRKIKEEKAPAKEKAAPKTKVVKEKKAKAPSAYGVSIDILGKNPDISASDLKKEVAKQGIDVEEKNSSITTAYSQFGKVVKVLRAYKHMK